MPGADFCMECISDTEASYLANKSLNESDVNTDTDNTIITVGGLKLLVRSDSPISVLVL